MFKSYNVASMDLKLLNRVILSLSVVKDHPLFKVLTDVGLEPIE